MTISSLGTIAGATPAEARTKRATFVLVHGAWHGGWCWKKLTRRLQAAGHRVFTPTLTGLGERSHLLSRTVGLATHIRDIAAVLEYEDLRRVVLVGHSYGGMVTTGVADVAGARLSHLVYLDAFLPEHGKALQDYAPVPPTREDGWRVPPPGVPPRFDVINPRDVAWMEERLGDQSLLTFVEPVQLTNEHDPKLSRSFIQCTMAPFFAEAANRARRDGFRVLEFLTAGHDAMITEPDDLAKLLITLARHQQP